MKSWERGHENSTHPGAIPVSRDHSPREDHGQGDWGTGALQHQWHSMCRPAREGSRNFNSRSGDYVVDPNSIR